MALAAQATEGELYRPVLGANPAHPSGWPVRLIVSSQTEARHNRADWAPTHLVSIRAPATRLLSMIELPAERHLELYFGDATDPDAPDAARTEAIESTFAFIDGLQKDAHLLIHCLRGHRPLDGADARHSGALHGTGERGGSPARAPPRGQAEPACGRPLRRNPRAQGQARQTGAAVSDEGLERLSDHDGNRFIVRRTKI
ncbi:hypothetical protein ABIA25_002467 [Sinorhizobium fredii]